MSLVSKTRRRNLRIALNSFDEAKAMVKVVLWLDYPVCTCALRVNGEKEIQIIMSTLCLSRTSNDDLYSVRIVNSRSTKLKEYWP